MDWNWNKFAKEVHQNAVDKGWYDTELSFDDLIANCICELAEAMEEWRNGRPNVYRVCAPSDGKPCCLDCGADLCEIASGDPCEHRGAKPEGVAVELGDCVLRILDYLATTDEDIDKRIIHCYARKNLSGLICKCARSLCSAYTGYKIKHERSEWVCGDLYLCVGYILNWAEREGVDMEAVLREKHEYNKTQPYRHGGKRV